MPHITVKIKDIKILSNEEIIPVVDTAHFKSIAKILPLLDQGHKPKTQPNRRTKQIYDSIRNRGYHPERYGHIQTYRKNPHITQTYIKNGEVILWSGNHRLAILQHMGHIEVTVHVQKREFLRRGLW